MIFKQETVKSWFTGIKTSINNEVIQPFQNAEQVIWKYNQAIQHNSLTQRGWERLLAQSDDGLKAYLTNIKGTTASMTGYTVSLQGNITGFKKVSSAIAQYNALATSGTQKQNEFSTAVAITNGRLGGYLRGLSGTKASLGGYVNSLVSATAKTIALQTATMALNAAVSMGITAAISLAVKGFDKLINSAKRASDAANEAFSESNSKVQQNKEEIKTLDELIQKYKELRKNENLDTDGRKQVKNLQNDIADLVGKQAQNLDLVNGKLDEEISKLDEISTKQAKNAYDIAGANYRNAVKANEKASGNSSIAFADGYAYVGDRNKEAEKILQDAGFINYYMQGGRKQVGGRGVGNNGFSTIIFDTYDRDGNLLKGAQEKLDYLKSMVDVLEQMGQGQSELHDGLLNQIAIYQSYIDNQKNAADSLIDSWITYSQYANEELSKINVDSVESFEQYRQKMIEAAKDDDSIGQILADGTLSEESLEIAINDFMSTATQFSEWYEQWLDNYEYQNTLNSVKSKFGDTFEIETDSLNEAKENLEYEFQKLSDWGLEDYSGFVQNGVQSVFGNVDMDKRTIITWSDELKQTYADALASWDYEPEIGGIDTVFGGSGRFGEDINGTGWEVAFTPILPDGTFLSNDTVYEYIESIVAEAYSQNGEVTENALKSIDAQGRQIGDTFVHGIFAAVDDSLDYDNNGNLAETVGRLMHFTGDFGAVKLAKQEIEDARKVIDWDSWFSENINTPEEIELFRKIMQEANSAADAIEKYKSARNGLSDTDPISLSITDTVEQLNTQLKPAFDSLQSAWNDIFTTDDDGKPLFTLADVDLSMFDSIKSKLDEMSDPEGLNLDVDYSAFEDFVNVLNNTESTEQNVQDAFDSLATSITQAALSGAEDFDTMRAALEDLGVINNELVAFDAMISNTEALKEAGLDLAHATDEQIAAFANEFVAAENVTQAIAMLTFHKELCNAQEMNTAGEVANLRTLAENAGYTGEVIQYLTELEQIYQEVASGTITPVQILAKTARAAMLKSYIDSAASNINYEPKVDFTKATDSAKKAGSKAGKKTADAYLEAFEKELEKLQGMRDRNEITEKEYLDRLRVA